MLRTRFRFRFVVVCASADMCGHVGACEQVLGGPAVFKNNRRFVLQQNILRFLENPQKHKQMSMLHK